MKFKFLAALLIISLSTDTVICAKKPALSAQRPKGRVSYLNSYLPAAMQVLAHLTNQLKFEREIPPQDATTSITTTTTERTTTTISTTTEATTQTTTGTTSSYDLTTQSHKPGIFAPLPPQPQKLLVESPEPTEPTEVPPIIEQNDPKQYTGSLLPGFNHYIPPVIPDRYPNTAEESQYVLPVFRIPTSTGISAPFYYPSNYQLSPNVAPSARSDDETVLEERTYPDISLLPVQNENNYKFNPLEIEPDELSDKNLQYLSPIVRDMLQKTRDTKEPETKINRWNPSSNFQSIEDLYDDSIERKNVADWLRAKKPAPSQSFIRLLLLYDLLSRDAKKQKLNNYQGYTDDLVKDLSDTSKGTAIEQLKVILDRMVARGDCTHDFANNRARDVISDLDKPDSVISKEVRYLDPLRFTE